MDKKQTERDKIFTLKGLKDTQVFYEQTEILREGLYELNDSIALMTSDEQRLLGSAMALLENLHERAYQAGQSIALHLAQNN